jgi:serine/threonine protein kinase
MPPPPSPADPASLLGHTLDGRYQAVAFIGEGDLGYVYRCEQTALRRACALKVLRPEVQRDRVRLARVMEGSQRVARGKFDAIVPVDDILTTADRTALVMPWLNGEDLGTALRQAKRLPWARLRDLLLQLGEALTQLHTAGFVFAGLKPSNVFLMRTGDAPELVRLLDVGLSRHDAATTSITYMAPEWISGGEPNPRTDIYALAALTYEALTGVPAFPGPPSQVALLKRVKPPPPLRSVAPDLMIPPQVEGLLQRSLERDPKLRPDIASFLTVLRTTIPVDEESATRFFPRLNAKPLQQHSQSGELSDGDLHTTGRYQPFSQQGVPTTLDLSAPVEATRINNPLVATTIPIAERTRINNPRVQVDQRTAASVTPPPVDCTAVAAPPLPTIDPTVVSPAPTPPPDHPRTASPRLHAVPPVEHTRIANASPKAPAEPQIVTPPPPRPRVPPAFPSPGPDAPPLYHPTAPFQQRPAATPTLEPTMFLSPLNGAGTQRLTTDQPGDSDRPPADHTQHTAQTARTALIPGFGGSLLGESLVARHAPAVGLAGPPSRISVWWSRLARRFHRPDTGEPRKPGLWARLRGVRVGNLPARRHPSAMDRFFRKLTELPSYIGRGWRLLYRPFGRLTALRSKLSTPLMSLRTSFGRLARIFSRWTGGGA